MGSFGVTLLSFVCRAFVLAAVLQLTAGLGDAQQVETLHSWSVPPSYPIAPLCKGSDGNFYGTSETGGGEGDGTVFKVTRTGDVTVIHSFADAPDGRGPAARLVEGPDGFFYGTTSNGGLNGDGTIFKISSGGDYAIVHNFFNGGGAYPKTALLLASDGNFYGTASSGGSSGRGTIFKLTPAGSVSTIHSFSATTGSNPVTDLIQGSDGNLYGATYTGGTGGQGTLFRATLSGSVTVLKAFSTSSPGSVQSGIAFDQSGNLYGTTSNQFFKLAPEGTFTTPYTFGATGNVTRGDLLRGADGAFYGTVIRGGSKGYGGVYRITPAGQFSVLASFDDKTYSGDYAAITADLPGTFFGVTNGRYSNTSSGTVFTVTADGTLSVLKEFRTPVAMFPSGPLAEGTGGELLGTTTDPGNAAAVFRASPAGAVSTVQQFAYNGNIGVATDGLAKGTDGLFYGVSLGNYQYSEGLIYRLSQASGVATPVANFPGGPPPRKPHGRLVQAADGAFYGTASSPYDNGSIFRVTPSGTLSVVKEFTGGADGKYPLPSLTLGSDGKLYGCTEQGGSSDRGTLFRITPGATPTFQTLATLVNTNGQTPTGQMVVGNDGNIYGTTLYGGSGNNGTFYRITTAGVHSVVAQFGTAAARPRGAIVIHPDGNFYGVTSEGGTSSKGAVYRVTAAGALSVLASFPSAGPNTPMTGLQVGADRALYGTTTAGGTGALGALFKIAPSGTGGIVNLTQFDYRTGNTPVGNLFRASNGKIYGLNQTGGTGGGGTLFTLNTTPTIPSASANLLTSDSARATGSIVTYGEETTVEFFLNDVSQGTLTLPSGSSAASPFEKTFTSLARHTTYKVRIEARSRDGVAANNQTFTTPNSSPVTKDDSIHATGTTVHIEPLSNDLDEDGDPLTITLVVGANRGTTTTDGKSIEYTGKEGFEGNDSLVYTVTDGFGGTAQGTITISNAAPSAGNATLHPPAIATSINVEISAYVTDPDSDSVTLVSGSDGAQGTLRIDGERLIYTPGATFTGNDEFRYEVSDSSGAKATGFIRFANDAPVAMPDAITLGSSQASFAVLSNDADADGDQLQITSTTGAQFGEVTILDGTVLMYAPSDRFEGVDSFSYTITDGRGLTSTAQVSIRASYPVVRTLAEKRDDVPGISNSQIRSFGIPSIFASGLKAGWRSPYSSHGRFFEGIFSGPLGNPKLQARTGSAAVDSEGKPLRGVHFTHFGEPVFAGNTSAFSATLDGEGVEAETNKGLWVVANGKMREIVRTGELAAGTVGERFTELGELLMTREDTVLFTAGLNSGKKTTDQGIWVWNVDSGLRSVVREGEIVNFDGDIRRVKRVRILSLVRGSSGHPRYTGDYVDGVIDFTDGSHASVRVDPDGVIDLICDTGSTKVGGRRIAAMGSPSAPGNGQLPAIRVTFGEATAGTPSSEAIVDLDSGEVIFENRTTAPGTEGTKFLRFADPVAGIAADGHPLVAVTGIVTGKQSMNTGIWLFDSSTKERSLLVRAGDATPGVESATFRSFGAISVVEGRGVVFTATIRSGEEKHRGKNSRGCWAMNRDGALQLVIREGQQMGGKTLRAFDLLKTVPGSSGQLRSWSTADSTPTLLCRAHYSDGTQSLITISLP